MKMIRNILIALLCVLVLLGAGLFVFLKIFDINKYRPRIEREASSFLKRDVRVNRLALDFTLTKGVTLNVQRVTVADSPRFSSGPIFSVETVYVNMDVLAYLLRREVLITAIELNRPQFNLMRDEAGEVNVQELVEAMPQNAALGPAPEVPAAGSGFAGGTSAKKEEGRRKEHVPLEMLIRSIRVTEGEFTFVDRAFNPPIVLPVKRINVHIKDFSLSRTFEMKLDCSVWSDLENIHAQAELQINANNGQLRFNALKLETNIVDVRLSRMPWYPLLRETLGMNEELNGKLFLSVQRMVVGGAGIEELSLDGQLVNGHAALEVLGTPLENIQFEIHMTEKDFDLRQLSLEYALGKISAKGKMEDYPGRQNFSAEMSARDMQLAQIIPPEMMPVLDRESGPLRTEGRIDMDFDAQGRGLTEQSLKQSLSGNGFLEIRDAGVRNMNLLRLVLDKLSFVPELVRKVEENLPPKYQDRIARNETLFEKVSASMHLSNAALTADEIVLSSEDVLLLARGRLDIDQNLTVEADFYIPQELSSHMTRGVDELSYLLDEEKRIHIPFKPYQGKLADFRIYPDVGDVGKTMFEKRGREELKKAILKAMGRDDEPPPQDQHPQQPSGTQDEAPPPEEQRPEEILIEGIFDAIFKTDSH